MNNGMNWQPPTYQQNIGVYPGNPLYGRQNQVSGQLGNNYNGYQLPDLNRGFMNQMGNGMGYNGMGYNFTPNSTNGMWNRFTDWFKDQSMLGDATHAGILPTTFVLAQAGLNTYVGWQQMKQAREQFEFDKQAYMTNLRNQTQLTNDDLIERQRNRHANSPGTWQAPDADWQRKHLVHT